MKKLNHLWEAFVGLLLPIPSIFIDLLIEIIKKDWPKVFVWKWFVTPLSIIILKMTDFIFFLIGFLLLVDAIQGLFTEESILPKIKNIYIKF